MPGYLNTPASRRDGYLKSHRLRDTFAVSLLEKGVPLEEVSKLLGHRSIRTTEKYYAKMAQGKAGPARRIGHRDLGDEKEEMRPRQIAHGGLAGPRISGLACSHMNAPVIGFPFDVPTWGEHLNAKDPLALVIRGHLYVEAALVRLIESAIVDKKALDVARLPFRAKVKFAKALGKLDSADARVVDVLGRLRDKFAHDLNTQLSAQDELDVHNAMSPRQRKIADALRNQTTDFLSRLRCDLIAIIVTLHGVLPIVTP